MTRGATGGSGSGGGRGPVVCGVVFDPEFGFWGFGFGFDGLVVLVVVVVDRGSGELSG